MNICGVLVHCAPDGVEKVKDGLIALPGVEIHGDAPGSRLIVTAEDTDNASAADSIHAIHRLPGVIAAAITYHSFEETNGGGAPKEPTAITS